ncbi:hypothetical protein GBF38_002422, partial [Nibea albiflora]
MDASGTGIGKAQSQEDLAKNGHFCVGNQALNP